MALTDTVWKPVSQSPFGGWRSGPLRLCQLRRRRGTNSTSDCTATTKPALILCARQAGKRTLLGPERRLDVRDPSITSGTGQLAAIQAVAPSFGVELTPVDMRDTGDIERTIAAFARGSSNGGLI